MLYGFPVAEKAFADANVKLVTLTDYEHVVEEALETGYIKQEDVELLHEWRKDPANWKVWGMESFGFSAPYKVLDEKLGYTGENVYKQVKDFLAEA